jgi:hypothetical protein
MKNPAFETNSDRVYNRMSVDSFFAQLWQAVRRFWRAERFRSLRLHPQAMIPVSALVAICQSTDLDLARCG